MEMQNIPQAIIWEDFTYNVVNDSSTITVRTKHSELFITSGNTTLDVCDFDAVSGKAFYHKLPYALQTILPRGQCDFGCALTRCRRVVFWNDIGMGMMKRYIFPKEC